MKTCSICKYRNRTPMRRLLISLFDLTGNASRPYKENGWDVIQIDKQLGSDIMDFNVNEVLGKYDTVGVIAMIPCTAYAASGNRHKNTPKRKELFAESQKLVEKVESIIGFLDDARILKFWQVENPIGDIHTHNHWLGKPVLKFNPCDYAGYDPSPDDSRYNKMTWLWGRFNKMEPKYMPPLGKKSKVWTKYGGASLRTKNARSITPLGFAYAFYEYNN